MVVRRIEELQLGLLFVGSRQMAHGFKCLVAVIDWFGRNNLSSRLSNSCSADTVRKSGAAAAARCLLLLQNSLQISRKPDCIRDHPGVEGRHVGIGVVVGPLLTTAAVSDDVHQYFYRGGDDERVTAQRGRQ